MSTMYIVSYSTGWMDDYTVTPIFATASKEKAESYVARFNRILAELKVLNKKFEHPDPMFKGWIDPQYADAHWRRWHSVHDTNECFYKEIELR